MNVIDFMCITKTLRLKILYDLFSDIIIGLKELEEKIIECGLDSEIDEDLTTVSSLELSLSSSASDE